jgi:predicted nucleic-acid-binding protein
MKSYFIDSNIFLRFLDDSSKQHLNCKHFFTLMEENKFKGIICSTVVLEIYFILRRFYRLPLKDCQQKIAGILKTRNLVISDNYNYPIALDLFIKSGIKLPDCLIASLHFLQKGGIIISYDKDFDKLGVKRKEPGSV